MAAMNSLLLHIILIVCLFAGLPAAMAAAEFTLPAVVGEISTTKTLADETLMEVALRTGTGYEALVNSNALLDPWQPGRGAEVTLPGQALLPYGAKTGLTINLAELRLFHVPALEDGRYRVMMYPLGIGRQGRETPEGQFRVVVKTERPQWRVPKGLREQDPALPHVVPPGPANPLGNYWLGLSAAGYGLHGTNRPFGVGRRVSYGCIRLYAQDIEALYSQVETGTPVMISYQPIKAAKKGKALLLEVHPDYLARFPDFFQHALNVIAKTGWAGEIDYARVRQAVMAQKGLPESVGFEPRHAP